MVGFMGLVFCERVVLSRGDSVSDCGKHKKGGNLVIVALVHLRMSAVSGLRMSFGVFWCGLHIGGVRVCAYCRLVYIRGPYCVGRGSYRGHIVRSGVLDS